MAYYDDNQFYVAEDHSDDPPQPLRRKRQIGMVCLIAGLVLAGLVTVWLV
ncbi:hypothetical protein [Lacticaseibacillus jixiensis]